MNRKEADIFEGIFIGRGFLERVNPSADAKDILESYEDLPLPEAIQMMTRAIVRNLENRNRGTEPTEPIN